MIQEGILTEQKKNRTEPNTAQEQKLYGNEQFGIPADCTKKQKFNGVKLAFYIVVVVLICGVAYSSYRSVTDYFLPEMTYNKADQPLIYVKNQELVAKKGDARKGVSVAQGEQYKKTGADELAQMTKDGELLFYAQDEQGGGQGFTLCYQSLSKLGEKDTSFEEKGVIDQGVEEFKISPEGKFVLYRKRNILYCSNLTKSYVVAADVTDYCLSKNNQQILYQKEEGKLYTRGTGEKDRPVLVDSGIQKVLSAENEYAKIYYIKGNRLYRKEMDQEAVCLAEDVVDGIMLGEYVYFIKEEERILRFQEVFSDDKAAIDKKITRPTLQEFTKEKDGETQVDYDAYAQATKEYEGRFLREKIRSYFQNHPLVETVRVLYSVKRDTIKEIDVGIGPDSLSYNSCKEAVAYKRRAEQKEKIKISTLTSVEDAAKQAEVQLEKRQQMAEYNLAILIKDKMPVVTQMPFPKGKMEISLDKKYLYCIENKDHNGRGSLVRYQIGSRGLRDKTVLCKNVTDFAVDGADSSAVVVFDGDKLGICMGNTYTHLSDSSCRDFFYVDGALFYFDEYDIHTKTGRLKSFREGKVKSLDMGVHAFSVRNIKNVVYIKHYNKEFGVGDLYVKNGNQRAKKLDICVSKILY